jgi:hypothetical protein
MHHCNQFFFTGVSRYDSQMVHHAQQSFEQASQTVFTGTFKQQYQKFKLQVSTRAQG